MSPRIVRVGRPTLPQAGVGCSTTACRERVAAPGHGRTETRLSASTRSCHGMAAHAGSGKPPPAAGRGCGRTGFAARWWQYARSPSRTSASSALAASRPPCRSALGMPDAGWSNTTRRTPRLHPNASGAQRYAARGGPGTGPRVTPPSGLARLATGRAGSPTGIICLDQRPHAGTQTLGVRQRLRGA